jgi:integrase
MARRQEKRFTVAGLKKASRLPGMHADGAGLYLKVGDSGAASWVLRYLADAGPPKRERYMGLGPFPLIGLADARQLAEAARRQRLGGTDPIEARRAQQRDRKVAAAKPVMTFRQCAEALIAAKAPGWSNPKSAQQWGSTLRDYAFPIFGALPVAAVDTALVIKALQPIWSAKIETASRTRGRIEEVLDWAATAGHRPAGDNPARWGGHLENLLAKPATAKAAAGQGAHHAALPYGEIGAFVEALRRLDGVAARALDFAILTAGRSNEVLGARWSEIDRAERVWTVPAARMKGKREHRVPLSDAALAILDGMASLATGGGTVEPAALVFPGANAGRPLGPMALRRVLATVAGERWPGLTVHGFRSSFRDWAAERTAFPAELAEMALAHVTGSVVERAYRRSDMFAKRAALADAWAAWCARPAAPEGAVVPLARRA